MANFSDNFSDLQELGINPDEKPDHLTNVFTKAAHHLQTLLPNVNNKMLLTLYGYYKQGNDGPCKTSKPYWFDSKAKSKWDAWKKLGNMPQDEAKLMYIETIRSLDPIFETDTTENGVKVSCMLEDNIIPFENMTIIDYIKEDIIEVVESLLKKRSESVNALDKEGLALIHWASDSGFQDIIELLLNNGADINLPDVDGLTPLHYASSCGHHDCVKYLLDKGAKADIVDGEGNSALDVAADDTIRALMSQ